jgi:hypothetical protein
MNFESKIGLHGDKEQGKPIKRAVRDLKISTEGAAMEPS